MLLPNSTLKGDRGDQVLTRQTNKKEPRTEREKKTRRKEIDYIAVTSRTGGANLLTPLKRS